MNAKKNDAPSDLSSIEQMKKWMDQHPGPFIQSTGSKVIRYEGILYNVSGSTKDPDEVQGCKGCSWIDLLEKELPGSKAKMCFVENSKAGKGTSHFKTGWKNVVGGHMTKNKDGHVEVGGTTYLMPLCKWDNSTCRNEEPFQVTDKNIVLLLGYMLPELYVTFAARLPAIGKNTFGLVYLDEERGIWRHKDIDTNKAKTISSSNRLDPNQYVLIEKSNNSRDDCKIQEVCN